MDIPFSKPSFDLPPAVARSMRLWTDPFSAPDVPPSEVLQRFVQSPESSEWRKLDYDIEAQIAESVNCQRALEHLPAGPVIDTAGSNGSAWRAAPDEVVRKALERIQAATPNVQAPKPQPLSAPSAVMPGQLWNVSTRGEVFDGLRYSFRRRWRVTDALVVGPAWEDQFGEEFVCVVAASPIWHWPQSRLGSDEIVVKVPGIGEYVAHLWLEFPFHFDQRAAYLGILGEAELDNLLVGRGSLISGHPPDESVRTGMPLTHPDDMPIRDERERLLEVANWLCATADARRLSTEAALEEAHLALPDKVIPLPALRKVEEFQRLLPVAGARVIQTPCFAHSGGFGEMIAAFVQGHDLPGLRTFPSIVETRTRQLRSRPQRAQIEWRLLERPSEIRGGETFFVINRRSRTLVLATGRTQPGGEFALVSHAPWSELRDTPESDLALFFPNIK